jgi:dTDP-4-amino-4,6-dideoxygalactose transaminase
MVTANLIANTGDVDEFLSGQFPGSVGALSFARGSTGLYALFSALRNSRGPGEVIIPGICCETVAMAAMFAGMRPVIVDVDQTSLCINPGSLKAVLGSNVRAIVVVHVFGCVAPTDEIAALCKGKSIVLIEDLAHAAGASDFSGRKLGTLLDCTLLSFSEGKIIKGKGGAIIFNRDRSLFEQARFVRSSLPAPPPIETYALLELSLRNLTHGIFDLVRANPRAKISRVFQGAVENYFNLIAIGASNFPLLEIADSFLNLPATNQERVRRHRLYEKGIRRPGTRVAKIPPSGTCWRCPVLFDKPEDAQAITRALRRAGVHASNHYFPLDRLLFDKAAPMNRVVGETIVNLWVDDTIPESMIQTAIDVINNHPLLSH